MVGGERTRKRTESCEEGMTDGEREVRATRRRMVISVRRRST